MMNDFVEKKKKWVFDTRRRLLKMSIPSQNRFTLFHIFNWILKLTAGSIDMKTGLIKIYQRPNSFGIVESQPCA